MRSCPGLLPEAFLRYHDPENWPVLREALKKMGRADLIGPGGHQLVPAHQPPGAVAARGPRRRPGGLQRFTTKGVPFPGTK